MSTNMNMTPNTGRVELAPRTLLVDVNIRHDTRLDKEFVASIKDLGVLVPIVAVRTPSGEVRVRFGHRRTLAAIEVGLVTVPVEIVGDEATDDSAQIDRIISQYAENEHRAGLTCLETSGVVEQLSAFGLSATQIHKRTRIKRDTVTDALAVASSDLAKAASVRYDFLSLEQAAAVAEFEDDSEAVKAIVAAAKVGRFDHTVQRLRDDRTERAAQREAESALTAAGVTVIDRPAWSDPVTALYRLRHDGEQLTEASHGDCPGHTAYVSQEWQQEANEDGDESVTSTEDEDEDYDEGEGSVLVWEAVYVCTDPAAYGHTDGTRSRSASGAVRSSEDAEAAKAERRRVIENNKAWRSAETVRREWLRTFLAGKTAPKGTVRYVIAAIAQGDFELTSAMQEGHRLAVDLLGINVKTSGRDAARRAVLDALTGTTDARAQVITLGLVLGAYEDSLGVHTWRSPSAPAPRRYLSALGGWGYELSDIERLVAGMSDDQDSAGQYEGGDDQP